ncbi:MAG: hypothetical protein RIQ47_1460 [Bacteroidota bacterium]|jgi:uncharacterized membrane protein
MTKPDKESLNKWHSDDANWKWGVFYVNKEDPRVWLPKRNPVMGWTLNFAHRSSYWWLFGLTFIPLIPVLLVALFAK